MVAVPNDTPVTTPVVEATQAAGELLLHTPPGVEHESVMLEPAQNIVAPVIAVGSGLTVKVAVEV